MTEPFMDQVAELAGQTTRTLEQIAEDLDMSGLGAQATTLRTIASLQRKLAHDCLTTTQPIDIARHDFVVRLLRAIEEIENISDELMMEGRGSSSELLEAVSLLQSVVDQQNK